ncbi:hypothetical protein RI367_007173 [Sorochytrium milnesiophthora]
MSEGAISALLSKSLTMLALILLALNFAGWLKKREFKYFGETALYIALGLMTSFVFRVLYTILGEEPLIKDVQLSTSFFYMVLLPPIIFEGGYTVQRMMFFKQLPTILSLAFIGGTFSTVVIAVVMFLAAHIVETPITMVESLIFGSLISSTDPVTILAMLPPETDKRLGMIIFGESAMNDAVSIILFRFFSALADPSISLTFGKFMMSLLESVGVFIGSFTTGVVVALLFAKLTKHQRLTHEAETYEVTMMLVFAYSSYLLAEVLHLTGIISVFFCGLAIAHYAKPNLTSTSILVTKEMLRIFSTMCDCFIFLYLGMGLFAFPDADYVAAVIIFALIGLALGRTHVFIICSFRNIWLAAKDRIPLAHQTFVWFSGLRGAVAFALAVQLIEDPDIPFSTRSLLFSTTVMCIVLTVFALNVFTPFMITKLGIDQGSAPQVTATSKAGGGDGTGTRPGSIHGGGDGGHGQQLDRTESDDDLINMDEMSGVLSWLYMMDKRYLRPFFSNPRRSHTLDAMAMDGHDAENEYTKVSTGIALHDLVKQESMEKVDLVATSLTGLDRINTKSLGSKSDTDSVRASALVGQAERLDDDPASPTKAQRAASP